MGRDDTGQALNAALEAVRAVYATADGVCGCCLHVVTDDGNLENCHVDFCYGYAAAKEHPLCITAAERIRVLSLTQRNKLYARYGEYSGYGRFIGPHAEASR